MPPDHIMPDNVGGVVVTPDLEITVISGQPAIDDLDYQYLPAAEEKPTRQLFIPVSGITVDPDSEGIVKGTHSSFYSPHAVEGRRQAKANPNFTLFQQYIHPGAFRQFILNKA